MVTKGKFAPSISAMGSALVQAVCGLCGVVFGREIRLYFFCFFNVMGGQNDGDTVPFQFRHKLPHVLAQLDIHPPAPGPGPWPC